MRKRWRCEEYLAWVRNLPCAHCGLDAGSEAHHIKGVGHYSGGGLKAPDYLTIPLCHEHHMDLHNGKIRTQEQWEWLARTLALFFHRMAKGLGVSAMRTMIRGIDTGPVVGRRA